MTRCAPRLITSATILGLIFGSMLAGPAAAGPAAADPGARDKAQQSERARHERTIAYWTAERIAAAQPRDFVRRPNGQLAPRAKPSKPPGQGGGGGTVTGASWTGGGPVVQRTGKVLFTMGAGDYVCSASVVQEPTPRATHSLVLTAAHCAYDEVANAFASNWLFIPSFDTSPTFTCANTTIGCWTAVGLVVHSGYATAGGFNTQATVHDFAIAIVAGGGKTGTSSQLDSAVGGGYGIAYPAISTGGSVHAFGYPAAGRYKGKDLVYCAGPTFDDRYNDDSTWGIACNMTGGSSGGPWLADFTQAGAGTLTSLNSYGYSGLSNMYGPKFDAATKAVVDAAAGRVANHIVP
ncbi:MAG: trypsin-like serine peptidase [Candidatus Limnocylindria bacterium]